MSAPRDIPRGSAHHVFEHVRRQHAGVRVVARAVVAVEETRAALEPMFGAVREGMGRLLLRQRRQQRLDTSAPQDASGQTVAASAPEAMRRMAQASKDQAKEG